MGMVKKWLWPVWSPDSKTDCIPKRNRWNKLFFLYAGTNSGQINVNYFGVGMVKNIHGLLVCEIPKSVVS